MLTAGIAAATFLVGAALAVLACRRTNARSDRLARLMHPSPPVVAAPPGDGSSEDEELIEPHIKPETVEALLENAKALADDEQERGASLKQRAGWLLGFLGVMLSLLLGQARELMRTDLGSVGKPLAAALVLIALVLIVDAARWALRTLSVVELWHVGPEEARRYPTYRYIGKQPEVARGEMLQGWVRQFADERPANDRKAQELQRAFRRLTFGIGVLAAVALILSARVFGL